MSCFRNINITKRAKIIALREEGLNFSEISRETGLTVSNPILLLCLNNNNLIS